MGLIVGSFIFKSTRVVKTHQQKTTYDPLTRNRKVTPPPPFTNDKMKTKTTGLTPLLEIVCRLAKLAHTKHLMILAWAQVRKTWYYPACARYGCPTPVTRLRRRQARYVSIVSESHDPPCMPSAHIDALPSKYDLSLEAKTDGLFVHELSKAGFSCPPQNGTVCTTMLSARNRSEWV